MQLYHQASELNYAVAQFNLAMMYETFELKESMLKMAFELYKKSAEQGFIPAKKIIWHDCIILEWERKKNLEEAFFWYNQASMQNDNVAQFNLALLYYKGEGTKKRL